MTESITKQLESARRDLLDLSARNRLLNTARSSSKSSRLDIFDEVSAEILRILVTGRKAMTFLPKNGNDKANVDDETQAQMWDYEEGADGPADRHTDTKLQTALEKDPLHKKLLKMFYDARTFEQEQGVNILYLALGFLEWKEQAQAKPRHAPLILVPVLLERQSARSRFKLRWSEEDMQTNLSLQEKLKGDFGLELPALPEQEDLDVDKYFGQIEKLVSDQKEWRVDRNGIVLWFFSFSKFLMYRDLLPEVWPEGRQVENHPLLAGLLHDGIGAQGDAIGEDQNIDELLAPSEQTHVVDADSSQALAIEEVRRGRNLVIQGPPGTGKSQTITNLIATAVNGGKKVLFVAEKMAALEVVKGRLDAVGLGNMVLELHSHKANKKVILQELQQTLGQIKGVSDGLNGSQVASHNLAF